jgi:hypothetical protein
VLQRACRSACRANARGSAGGEQNIAPTRHAYSNFEDATMAIYGMSPLTNNYGGYGNYGNGAYGANAAGNSLAQLQNQSDAASNQAASSGSPQDAQKAKEANNKMTEAAQMQAARETARHEAFQTLMR